jgi:hypothetical protein
MWTKSDKNKGPLQEDLCTFMIMSCSILLRMRNFSDKSSRENQSTHFMFNNFFWKSYHLWNNVEKYGRARQATDDNIIWCMCFACWLTKATGTHPEYAIFIPFPQQQLLHEHTSMLHYRHIACLVKFSNLHKYMHSVSLLTFLMYVFNNHKVLWLYVFHLLNRLQQEEYTYWWDIVLFSCTWEPVFVFRFFGLKTK